MNFKKVALFLLLIVVFACTQKNSNEKIILAGTSIITSLIKDLNNDIKVINLIPPKQCPGHFDLKPDDAILVAKAEMFIIHPYQKYLFEKIKRINKDIKLGIIKTPDLTIPENYFSALKEMENILKKFYPEYSEVYEKNRIKKIRIIKNEIAQDEKFLESLKKRKFKVVSSKFQKNFSQWLGFEVVATFGSPDSLTMKQINSIIEIAKQKKINFIISNLAGNHNITAKILNKYLNKRIIIFSNFPELNTNKSLFLNLWHYNLSELKKNI